MSLKQTKHLYRELASFRFISNFKSIRKPGGNKQNIYIENCILLDSHQISKALENQELVNAVMKDVKLM